MALPENTTYKGPNIVSKGLETVAKMTQKAAQSRGKTPNLAQFSGLRGMMTPKKTAPSTPRSVPTSGLGTVTVPYGGSTKFEKFHPAVDIANNIGTPVPAYSSGVVQEVVTGYRQGDKGYGNYITIKDSKGNLHRYSHLNNAFVKVGQPVLRGTLLGGMGNTGAAYSTSGGTGSHLDYRVKDAYDKYVNPYSFING